MCSTQLPSTAIIYVAIRYDSTSHDTLPMFKEIVNGAHNQRGNVKVLIDIDDSVELPDTYKEDL